MGILAGVSTIIGTILAILTFYFSTYLPYINGENNPATETFTPLLERIPGAEEQHIQNKQIKSSVSEEPPTGIDSTPPVISVPNDIVAEATSSDGAVVEFEVTAEDNVDGAVDVSCDPESGSTFQIGETDVNCEATNAAGNIGRASFKVIVNPQLDRIAPTITVPAGITTEATSSDGAVVEFEVTAEDNVDGAVDVNCDHNSGDTFPTGDTVVTCSAVDAAGNRAEESFTITVQAAD